MSEATTAPLVIGHRGARGMAPENTREAFLVARDVGLEWVEVDVRVSRDGEPLLWHDPVWNGLPIAGTRYSDLQDARGTPLHLHAFLDEFGSIFSIDFDLKTAGAFGPVVREVRRRRLEPRTILSSFDHVALYGSSQASPDIEHGAIIACRPWDPGRFPAPMSTLSCVIADHEFVDAAALRIWRDRGLRCLVYTVDTPEVAQVLSSLGVQGLITDRPDLLLQGMGALA